MSRAICVAIGALIGVASVKTSAAEPWWCLLFIIACMGVAAAYGCSQEET